jgi:predicted ATPase with chaperone activity
MDARFEIRLVEGERRELRDCSGRSGLSAAAIARFGIKWAIGRLDVLANGGAQKTGQDIAALLDELRADPRLAPAAGALEAALAALDREGDANRNAAALYDMVGLIAAEPLPLAEKLQLLGDLLAFEGRLTIRRQIEPAQISPAFQKST